MATYNNYYHDTTGTITTTNSSVPIFDNTYTTTGSGYEWNINEWKPENIQPYDYNELMKKDVQTKEIEKAIEKPKKPKALKLPKPANRFAHLDFS